MTDYNRVNGVDPDNVGTIIHPGTTSSSIRDVGYCTAFGRCLRFFCCCCNAIITAPCIAICGEDCLPACCTNGGTCDPDGNCCESCLGDGGMG